MSFLRRYFDVVGPDHTSPPHLGAVHTAVVSAEKLMREKKWIEAAVMLESALEQHKSSQELWLCYLKTKSRMTSPTQLTELYQLFPEAIAASQSYDVILEVSWLTLMLCGRY